MRVELYKKDLVCVILTHDNNLGLELRDLRRTPRATLEVILHNMDCGVKYGVVSYV